MTRNLVTSNVNLNNIVLFNNYTYTHTHTHIYIYIYIKL